MASNDPRQWVKSPPSTFVVVSGTSRDSVNGSRGLILQYDDSKGRYLILLCASQQQVSLKTDNLTAAGMIDQAKAYYEMIQNSPDIQRQLRSFIDTIRSKTGGMDPRLLGVGLLGMVLLSCYGFGITKTMLLLSIVLLLAMIFAQDLLSTNANFQTILQNAPIRWKTFLRENIPQVGNAIADNPLYLSAFTVLAAVLLLLPLFSSSSSKARASVGSTYNNHDPSHYYKLGYEDATANLDFGASLDETPAAPRTLVDDDEEWLPPTASAKSPFSISTAMAVFAIVRTVYPLGNDGSGGWNAQLAMANLQALPKWRMGLLAFAVYRLVAAFV